MNLETTTSVKAVIFDLVGVVIEGDHESPAMLQLIRNLQKNKIRVFILSNIFENSIGDYQKKFKVFSLADKVYFAASLGWNKADSKTYDLILKENKLQPAQCLFVDDVAEYAAAAANLGLGSHVFKNIPDLENFLTDSGLNFTKKTGSR